MKEISRTQSDKAGDSADFYVQATRQGVSIVPARGAGTLSAAHHRTEGEMRAEVPKRAAALSTRLDFVKKILIFSDIIHS